MYRHLATLAAAGGLLILGGLGGAAITASPQPGPAAPVASVAPSPPEVRTKIVRRTIHVYRRPKPIRPVAKSAPAPAPSVTPAPVVTAAPAPVRASAPVAPVRRAAPIVTRTSGAGGHGGEHEHEDENEGGDD